MTDSEIASQQGAASPTQQAVPAIAGWLLVGIGFFALAVSFSARAAFSLAMPVWNRDLGWSTSFSSFAGAAALIVMALVAPFAGNLVDRHGPRRLLALGLVAIAAGMTLVALLPRGWALLVGFSLIAAIGFGMVAQHVVVTAIIRVMREKRGLASGVATSGSTAGQLLLVPLLAMFMQQGGWRWSFFAFGLAGLALAGFIYLLPQQGGAPRSPEPRTAARHDESLRHRLGFLLGQPAFHALFWSFLICGFTTTGAIETHLLPFAAFCGLPPLPSATAYGLLSAVNFTGMILAGWLADRMNRPLLLGLIYILRAISFVVLFFVTQNNDGDLRLLTLFAVFFGLVDYATVPVTASLVASHLGLRIMGLAMGLIAAGHAIGGALGAFFGGWLAEKTGGYDGLWSTSLALALLAGMMALLLREKPTDSPILVKTSS